MTAGYFASLTTTSNGLSPDAVYKVFGGNAMDG